MTTAAAEESTADQRWDAWKKDGARLEQLRKDRMRNLFAAVCFGGVIWLLAKAF